MNRRLSALAFALSLAACSTPPVADGGVDASMADVARADSGIDVAIDTAHPDAAEAAVDVAIDTSVIDVASDTITITDTGVDVVSDRGADVAPVEAGTDAHLCVDPHVDCAPTGTACVVASCAAGGACVVANAVAGTTCAEAGGHVCDGSGVCVGCIGAADCGGTGVCVGHMCVAASCTDGIQDGAETDSDCGGPCLPCHDGRVCRLPTDCQSMVCTSFMCATATCTDGVHNGMETGVDCGGVCPSCPAIYLLAGSSASLLGGVRIRGAAAWTTSAITDGTSFAPSLTATTTGLVVGAITSSSGSEVRATSYSASGWSMPTIVSPAAIARDQPFVDATRSTVVHLSYQDTTYHYWHTSFGSSWSAPQAAGPVAQAFYGPQPAAIAARGADATLAFFDGQSPSVNFLAQGDLVAGSWQPRFDVAGPENFNIPPAIISLGTGPDLLATAVQTDTHVFYVTRTAGVWTAPAIIPNCLTNDRMGLASLPGGGAILAFRGTDGNLYWTQYTSGAWSTVAPFATPNIAVSAAPAVTHGIGGDVAEIAYVSGGVVYQAGLVGSAWSAPVMVGGSGIVGVSIVASP